jgi:hypothetical protein
MKSKKKKFVVRELQKCGCWYTYTDSKGKLRITSGEINEKFNSYVGGQKISY